MKKRVISVSVNAVKFPGLHAALGIDMKPGAIRHIADSFDSVWPTLTCGFTEPQERGRNSCILSKTAHHFRWTLSIPIISLDCRKIRRNTQPHPDERPKIWERKELGCLRNGKDVRWKTIMRRQESYAQVRNDIGKVGYADPIWSCRFYFRYYCRPHFRFYAETYGKHWRISRRQQQDIIYTTKNYISGVDKLISRKVRKSLHMIIKTSPALRKWPSV